ncbi:MAG: 50S ribosomal protein L21 [Candidatus Eisenbacteria bacterium]|nr:50S ribosomal protein L21 [Candidatus Eisenbacteria bacterium]
MYAIVELQGRQYRVEPGARLQVPLLSAEPGSRIAIEKVLVLSGDEGVRVGHPHVEGASVEATVVRHGRGPKVLVGKYKKRKDYRRRNGYRDDYTEVEIVAIHAA